MTHPTTLTGYLGRNPRTCQTQERTITARRVNRVAGVSERYEYRTRSRDYLVLSLATHDRGRTTWHRLVVWNSDRMCCRNLRFFAVGDLVEVTGVPDVFRYRDAAGKPQEIHQFIVHSGELLLRKRGKLCLGKRARKAA